MSKDKMVCPPSWEAEETWPDIYTSGSYQTFAAKGLRKFLLDHNISAKKIIVTGILAAIGTTAVTVYESNAAENAHNMQVTMGCTGRQLVPVDPGETYDQLRTDVQSLIYSQTGNKPTDTQIDAAIYKRNPDIVWGHNTDNKAVVPDVPTVAVPTSCPKY